MTKHNQEQPQQEQDPRVQAIRRANIQWGHTIGVFEEHLGDLKSRAAEQALYNVDEAFKMVKSVGSALTPQVVSERLPDNVSELVTPKGLIHSIAKIFGRR